MDVMTAFLYGDIDTEVHVEAWLKRVITRRLFCSLTKLPIELPAFARNLDISSVSTEIKIRLVTIPSP